MFTPPLLKWQPISKSQTIEGRCCHPISPLASTSARVKKRKPIIEKEDLSDIFDSH